MTDSAVLTGSGPGPHESHPSLVDQARRTPAGRVGAGGAADTEPHLGRLATPRPVTAERSRWLALVVLCVGVLMIVLDATVVNVALPSVQRDLGFSQAGLAWVVNAYLIAFGGLLLLAGRLGDLLGRRRTLLVGLTVFTAASLACGLAQSQLMLVAARFVQGAGGALTSAVILGMIVTMFPEPGEQARAIGVYAFVASAGGAVGLLAGGLLTQAISWHWIFFVNLPIGIATAVLAHRLVPADEGLGFEAGADVLGAFLVTSALMLGVFTIVKPAAEEGWLSATTLSLGGLSLLLLAGFVVRQHTCANPLMPLRIFGSRNVAGANLVQIVTVAGMFGTFFLGALYAQRVLGYGPIEIGLAFLPVTVVMGTLSVRYTEGLVVRFGARRAVVAGLLVLSTGFVWFAQAPVGGEYLVHLFPVMVLVGAGAGLSFPALMTLAMSGATPSDAGLASGLINTTAQVGGAVGLAVLATVSATRTTHLLASGASPGQAAVGGFHVAFWIAAALSLAAVVVALTVLRAVQPAPEAADPMAASR